ncbi:CIA30 family protein [Nodosilinea nodulosa]|uniref:CIA30 family protein n=1 Tax=Nodosilinea nodulosa TaxID=416001 RepID=UPI0002F89537|nr:CIA30 family protein [Nodosilinea nodulosa]
MVWNPLRLLKTLVHFDVAGPISPVLKVLPGLADTDAARTQMLNPDDLIPTPPPPGARLLGGATDTVDGLVETLRSLGYSAEAAPWTAVPPEAANIALVVCQSASPDPNYQVWIEKLGQMTTYQEAILVDFQQLNPAIAALWGSLDDGVMGGVSASQVQWQDGLRFVGRVSTANSGGFASIRTRNIDPPLNLSQWQGTVLHAQGDGQRYKWILRDNPGWDSLAYCRSFDTEVDRVSEVRVPFLGMTATRRARTVPEASPLNPAQIYSMQLMLSKFEYDGDLNPAFQAGPFELSMQRLGVYRQGPKPLLVLPQGGDGLGAPLAAAGLTGVVPAGTGVAVIGAQTKLPPEVKPVVVEAIFQASYSEN